jgi:hypothetical protein
MALWVVDRHAPGPPSDMLMTRAGFALAVPRTVGSPAAHRIAAAMSLDEPPHLPSTRTGSTFTPGAMPLIPVLLPWRATIVPVTCVPCHELSLLPSALSPPQLSSSPPAAVPWSSAAVIQSPGSDGSASQPLPSFARTYVSGTESSPDTKS